MGLNVFDSRLLADILWLADSALPVGSFSHSFGLETVLAGRRFAHDGGGLEDLLAAWLRSEWGGVDGPAFALAHAAARAGDFAALLRLDARVHAMRLPAEWRRGGAQIGRQLLRLAGRVGASDGAHGTPAECAPSDEAAAESLARLLAGVEAGETPGQLPVAAGVVYAAWSIPLRASLTGFLCSTVQSLVAAATRLVPLGQLEGQVLLRRLSARSLPLIDSAAGASDPSDLGGFGPYFEIEGMNHEILETRLFIS